MAFCTRRYIFLSICLLQVLTVVEREVFDFLGYLWIPILINFFEIIFIIFGFFGAYQYRPKYLIAFLLWHVFWIGWNVFLICLYLNVGGLDHEKNKVLKLDVNSDSWWKKEGPGCRIKDVDAIPIEYEGCLVDYVYIEVFQAGVQCFFSMLNTIVGIYLSCSFLEEDDTFNYEKPNAPDSILLRPKYVTSDFMHSSNTFLHNSNNYLYSNQDSHRKNSHLRADTIRDPKRRNNSFDTLVSDSRKSPKRPMSLSSDAYID